ncbi:D-alanine--D-alanine ligase [Thermanaerovibrio velox DSM 12556]|uniref:D-alanine--D-alanine ligase n=1 Tax=Thermanaerovibrio velox DSM 12556 TaxID=926567 RepID=H0UQC7_9BACT|nr:D-alanine--D-alanine ligase [Thermanaerovibrio velox]EHM09681.1 D-alanine--D-alanine ligase [Thermanaerovibrio velox DSM 12556]
MKVLVAYGGDSPEREVSLRSGEAVAGALRGLGWSVEAFDAPSPLAVARRAEETGVDMVFVALHGGWGEDGTLQCLLEAHGIPYTGPRWGACWACMDKDVTRAVLESRGVLVPPGVVVDDGRCPGDLLGDALERWGRIVVKPCRCGSTVGIGIVDNPGDLGGALQEAVRYDRKVVAERFIAGRELTVAVFDGEDGVFALPPVEIRPVGGFYDYNSKYTPGMTEYLCPAPLTHEELKEVSDAAVRAYVAMGCSVYSRVDLRLEEGTCRAYVLEVNTAPGMTATSLVPKAAKAFGWSFEEMLRRICETSLRL